MSAINIPLFELGKSNRDLYNICDLVLKAKDIKTITPEIVTAGGACLVELFAFNPALTIKYTTQLKTALGTTPNTRSYSFQFNTNSSKYDNYEYIPRYYAGALNSYVAVFKSHYSTLNSKYGLPESESTYRSAILSASDLLTTIAKLCNILLPLCKRKKVDCFHIQSALKIIYLADNAALGLLLIKTINSTAKLLVNDTTIPNTVKTDAMISKTVATFNSVLTPGLTVTNEAAVYLSMFMLSLNPDIPEPDKLVTLSEKRTVSKKKKSPSATPSAKKDTVDDPSLESSPSAHTLSGTADLQDTPDTANITPDITPDITDTSKLDTCSGPSIAIPPTVVAAPAQKLSFKLKF
jgi:hypothetical protein